MLCLSLSACHTLIPAEADAFERRLGTGRFKLLTLYRRRPA